MPEGAGPADVALALAVGGKADRRGGRRGGDLRLYTIAAHRGFADAFVAGLLARYGSRPLGLAHVTLLLPNRRAQRILTEAFIRAAGALEVDDGAGGVRPRGLLLPRMAVVGDLYLDDALSPLIDHMALSEDGLDADAGSDDAVHAAVTYVGGMTDRFACRQGITLLGWSLDQLPKGIDTPV